MMHEELLLFFFMLNEFCYDFLFINRNCLNCIVKLIYIFFHFSLFSLDERDAIQKKTFTKWVNKHLKKVKYKYFNSKNRKKSAYHGIVSELQAKIFSLNLKLENKRNLKEKTIEAISSCSTEVRNNCEIRASA